MNQTSYIKKFLKKYDMKDCRSVFTSIDEYSALTSANDNNERTNQLKYQRRLNSIMYAMIDTRSDIAFVIEKLSQYSHDSANRHRIALDRVLRYLKKTSDLDLAYNFSQLIESIEYSDSIYANDKIDRKFTHDMILILDQAACIWNSIKRKTTSTFIIEIEYVAICQVSKQLVWARRWLYQLSFRSHDSLTLMSDNQACLTLIKNSEQHFRTKHIDVQYHYIRKVVNDNFIRVSYCSINEMIADILTKSLITAIFEKKVKALKLIRIIWCINSRRDSWSHWVKRLKDTHRRISFVQEQREHETIQTISKWECWK